MDYKEKYLNYKKKYLLLKQKKHIGGMLKWLMGHNTQEDIQEDTKERINIHKLERTKSEVHNQKSTPFCWAYAAISAFKKVLKSISYKDKGSIIIWAKKFNISDLEDSHGFLVNELTKQHGCRSQNTFDIVKNITKENKHIDAIKYESPSLETIIDYVKYENVGVIISVSYNKTSWRLLKRLAHNTLNEPVEEYKEELKKGKIRDIRHAMFVEKIGYEKDNTYYFIIKNSHSEKYGNRGYLHINSKYLYDYFPEANFIIIKPKNFYIMNHNDYIITNNIPQRIANICEKLDLYDSKLTECLIRLQILEHYLLDKPFEYISSFRCFYSSINNVIKRFCILQIIRKNISPRITSETYWSQSLEEILEIYNRAEIKPEIYEDILYEELLSKIIIVENDICSIENCHKFNLYTKHVDLLFYNIHGDIDFKFEHEITDRITIIEQILSKNYKIIDEFKKSEDTKFNKTFFKLPFYDLISDLSYIIPEITINVQIIDGLKYIIKIKHSEWFKLNIYEEVKYELMEKLNKPIYIYNIQKNGQIIDKKDTFRTIIRDPSIMEEDIEVQIIPYELNNENIRGAVLIWYNKRITDNYVFVPDYLIKNKEDLEKIYGHITKWDVSNITNMDSLFNNIEDFKENLSEWDVSNVLSMENMFKNCKEFSGLEIAKWNVSNVTNMKSMFQNCFNFNVYLSNWANKLSKVTTMENMFNNCINYKGYGLNQWNTSSIKNMENMFKGCKNFIGNTIETWNTNNVETMSNMFEDCIIFNADLSKWGDKLSKVKTMKNMFNSCINYQGKGLYEWNTSNVENMEGMFVNCRSFTGKAVENWDTNNVKNMSYMFEDCIIFIANLSNWSNKLNKVTTMIDMFNGCINYKGKGLDNWELNANINTQDMFDNCPKLITPKWYIKKELEKMVDVD